MFLVKEIRKSEQWILFKRKFGEKRIQDKGRVEISVTKFGSTNIFHFTTQPFISENRREQIVSFSC